MTLSWPVFGYGDKVELIFRGALTALPGAHSGHFSVGLQPLTGLVKCVN